MQAPEEECKLDDQVLGQLLLEYGFLEEEQLEAALERQKKSPEKRTLAQLLIQEGTLSVRALKTLHATAERRKETSQQQDTLQRRFETRKQQTKSLIRTEMPEAELPLIKKQKEVGFGIKKSADEQREAFKPLTLGSLKDDLDSLKEQVSLLRDEMKLLKGTLRKEILGELQAYLDREMDSVKE
jgi:hypothetical protein